MTDIRTPTVLLFGCLIVGRSGVLIGIWIGNYYWSVEVKIDWTFGTIESARFLLVAQ